MSSQRNLNHEEGTAAAAKFNTAARVQSVLIGRLIAELPSAIEDVAALGWAVRHRRKGLFATYLRASVGDAATFLDLARVDPTPPLAELLRLPPLTAVEAALDPDASAAIAHDYAELPRALSELGNAYRASGTAVAVTGLASTPKDQVHVVLDLVDPGASARTAGATRGLLPAALNKLKHRFALIEDIESFGALPGPAVLYAHLGRNLRTVDALVERVVYVSRLGLEIAVLVGLLADAGLDGTRRRNR